MKYLIIVLLLISTNLYSQGYKIVKKSDGKTWEYAEGKMYYDSISGNVVINCNNIAYELIMLEYYTKTKYVDNGIEVEKRTNSAGFILLNDTIPVVFESTWPEYSTVAEITIYMYDEVFMKYKIK